MAGRDGWWFDVAWSKAKNPLSWPMCSSLHLAQRRWLRWLLLLEHVGPWSNVLKRAKERLAWISMKFDPGRDGIVTSLCACSLTPFLGSCEDRVRCSCHRHSKMRKKTDGNPPCHTLPPGA